MVKFVIAIAILFILSTITVDASTCTAITIGYNSFTRVVTVTSQSDIKNIKFTKMSDSVSVLNVTYNGNEVKFLMKSKNDRSWRVDFTLTDECKSWPTYLSTTNLE